MPELTDEVRDAIVKVLEGFDEGIFLRDISADGKPGWMIRATPYVTALVCLDREIRRGGKPIWEEVPALRMGKRDD